MRGKHHIVVESPRLKYEFEIKRNLTIIRGESATGKTTLIELLEDYRASEDSAVQISSDVPCRVFSDNTDTWKQAIAVISDSIVFIDEDNHFIRTREFAEVVKGNTNYFVLITREALPELPYSIEEIYGIRTSGKYHFPEQIYHEFYPLYERYNASDTDGILPRTILTEDSASGFQFFSSFFHDPSACISARGNSGIYQLLKDQPESTMLAVIADGAAFGPFIEEVVEFAELRQDVMLYFPESFEWLILQSGVATTSKHLLELDHPEDYIDSKDYMSWEQFFTEFLANRTQDDPVRRYQKSKLQRYYLQEAIKQRIIAIIPEELQLLLTKK